MIIELNPETKVSLSRDPPFLDSNRGTRKSLKWYATGRYTVNRTAALLWLFASSSGKLVVTGGKLCQSSHDQEETNIVGDGVTRLLGPSRIGFALTGASLDLDFPHLGNLKGARGSDRENNSVR